MLRHGRVFHEEQNVVDVYGDVYGDQLPPIYLILGIITFIAFYAFVVDSGRRKYK